MRSLDVRLRWIIRDVLFSRGEHNRESVKHYSDAGGMLRLNIDELTPETDPARLLGPGH